MKIEYERKVTWFTKKTRLVIHDFIGEKKDLQQILENLKVVPK